MRGCLEISADGRALTAEAPGDPAGLLGRAFGGEPPAAARAAAAAEHLGRALAILTNLFDPERVVLSGLLGQYLSIAPRRIHAELSVSVVARARSRVVIAGSLANPVLIGAAQQAFTRLLARPRLAAKFAQVRMADRVPGGGFAAG